MNPNPDEDWYSPYRDKALGEWWEKLKDNTSWEELIRGKSYAEFTNLEKSELWKIFEHDVYFMDV